MQKVMTETKKIHYLTDDEIMYLSGKTNFVTSAPLDNSGFYFLKVSDICYDDQELKLISLAVNPQAMRYEDITGFEIDTLEKKLKTTSAEYSYTDMVVVSGDKGLISIDELVNLDVIDMVIFIFGKVACNYIAFRSTFYRLVL